MAFLLTKLPSLPSLLCLLAFLFWETAGADRVPAIYVFGDSTADVGNNNYLPGSTAKANFPHNGVDFPAKRATGRFSNGYNGIDFLAMHIGFKRSPPPFLSIASKIHHRIVSGIKGANFASGGSGILDSTGDTMSTTNQIENFATVRSNMTSHLSEMQADFFLSKSIFIISTGGNDIFGYFLQNNAPNATEKEKFITTLVSTYKYHLEKLYNLGARKFGMIDIPPIGCCPFPRSLSPTGGCLDVLNELSLQFNKAAMAVMHELSLTLKGMKYSIGSSNAVVSNIIRNPAAVGIKETKTACCGGGKFNGELSCTPNASFCSERNRYLFWDKLHPTHAASKLAGLAIYGGSPEFASPINFKQLVEEDD
ncbi:GDSL esterase/lipase At5g55050 [Dendrobium catenatum]|uniref:GDSL esterase/lipase n=1 Tax=Dendrobium catenatum TaxID=906689 RepID=A0A2I0X779_9ASPA|nr:GDSL esterase/lipase At5g55050 [Dendrobium catenatum]PKU83750.1 GDSL esterase/lipase [Dendrobium catenatum]